MVLDKNKSIPCEVTKFIQLSTEDSFKTKIDVAIYNQQPYKLYCQ